MKVAIIILIGALNISGVLASEKNRLSDSILNMYSDYRDDFTSNLDSVDDALRNRIIMNAFIALELADGSLFSSISLDIFKQYNNLYGEAVFWFSKGRSKLIVDSISIGCYEALLEYKKKDLLMHIDELENLHKSMKLGLHRESQLRDAIVQELIKCRTDINRDSR